MQNNKWEERQQCCLTLCVPCIILQCVSVTLCVPCIILQCVNVTLCVPCIILQCANDQRDAQFLINQFLFHSFFVCSTCFERI